VKLNWHLASVLGSGAVPNLIRTSRNMSREEPRIKSSALFLFDIDLFPKIVVLPREICV